MEKIVPIFNHIITTANKYTEEQKTSGGLYIPGKDENAIATRQTILAIGETCSRALKVGMEVELNPVKYFRSKQEKKTVLDKTREDYETTWYVVWPIETCNNEEILYLSDSDIKWIYETEEAI